MTVAQTKQLTGILAIPVVAYIGYKLALEAWCIAYGLIY